MKAIALISGGLDSILAARLIKGLSIEVTPLNFKIPFCAADKKLLSRGIDKFSLVRKHLGADLRVVDIGAEFLKLLDNPRYGFGANLNPCIDCKILMLSKAKDLMPQLGAEFVVTGEVLGQRSMSQHRQALLLIEKKAGLEGLLVRPLSARLLPETLPEKEGWIKRAKLMAFSGRSRKPQMELAKSYAMQDYPNASGGCLLTDPEFTRRLGDLISHDGLNLEKVQLLKLGRHYRLAKNVRLVVGRNEKENMLLAGLAAGNDYLFMPKILAGPTALGRGDFDPELIRIACRVTCRYCDLNGKKEAEIFYRKASQDKEEMLQAAPLEEEEITKFRI